MGLIARVRSPRSASTEQAHGTEGNQISSLLPAREENDTDGDTAKNLQRAVTKVSHSASSSLVGRATRMVRFTKRANGRFEHCVHSGHVRYIESSRPRVLGPSRANERENRKKQGKKRKKRNDTRSVNLEMDEQRSLTRPRGKARTSTGASSPSPSRTLRLKKSCLN